ncbi:MAG TPA: hypothetical protein VKB34_21465, partial [Povalibacter sp.]|nr:hypothetical protein [Povalibacter sp.]
MSPAEKNDLKFAGAALYSRTGRFAARLSTKIRLIGGTLRRIPQRRPACSDRCNYLFPLDFATPDALSAAFRPCSPDIPRFATQI